MKPRVLKYLNRQISRARAFVSIDFKKKNWIVIKVDKSKIPVKLNCTEELKSLLRQRIMNSIYYTIIETYEPHQTKSEVVSVEIRG